MVDDPPAPSRSAVSSSAGQADDGLLAYPGVVEVGSRPGVRSLVL